MSKPKYRAYKPVTETDGITSWVHHAFDNTVAWTPDDIAMSDSRWRACAPDARIAAMLENLDSLKNPTSTIQLNADEIRAIYKGLSSDGKNIPISKEDHAALHRADELWDHIVMLRDVMPKAVMGENTSKANRAKAKLPRSIISEIKAKLVSQYPDYMAKELWPHLFAELQRMELDPEDNCDVPGKEWYSYDHKDGRKKISFRRFANIKINE